MHRRNKKRHNYDAKHITKTNITLGDVVLVKNMKNTHRMGGKLDIRWTGPYEVIDDIGKMRYKVKCKKTGKTLKQILHSSRLKHYYHDVSWVIKYVIVPAILCYNYSIFFHIISK